jgi:hypothetical protein
MNKPTIVAIIIFALFLAIVSPILFIWSLNTLFGLSIAYGFFEWLAALILVGTLTGGGARFTGKNG